MGLAIHNVLVNFFQRGIFSYWLDDYLNPGERNGVFIRSVLT